MGKFFVFGSIEKWLIVVLCQWTMEKIWIRSFMTFTLCNLSLVNVPTLLYVGTLARWYVAVAFRHSCLTVFAWRRVVLRFSTQNNCCEFLAFYGVNTQSVIESFLKTPVCGASLSHYHTHPIRLKYSTMYYTELGAYRFLWE